MDKFKSIIQLVRVQHWVKNLLVFIPIFFAGNAGANLSMAYVLHAFIAFCLMSSAVYIFNDYIDIEADRLHPKKKNRPLASGRITKRFSSILAVSLFLIALLFASTVNKETLLIILLYSLINFGYTLYLKQIALLDISLIAIGFLLRIFAGGFAAGVPISQWLIVITFVLALMLALGKRRGEMISQNGDFQTRPALRGYSLPFMDAGITFLSAIIVVAYLMYTFSDEVVERIGSEKIYFTSLFVILGIMRYLQLTFVFQKSESPTRLFWRDRFIQILLLGWIMLFGYLIYFK